MFIYLTSVSGIHPDLDSVMVRVLDFRIFKNHGAGVSPNLDLLICSDRMGAERKSLPLQCKIRNLY
jgi:hypothetical protein